MAKVIKNIKAGQKFKIIDNKIGGFEIGCIVEALHDVEDIKTDTVICKWIGGYKPSYLRDGLTLSQNVQDLKRFKGKIK